jgi:hypothetical protein
VEQLRLVGVQEETGLAWRPVHRLIALAPEQREIVIRLMAQLLLQTHQAQGGGDDRPAR